MAAALKVRRGGAKNFYSRETILLLDLVGALCGLGA